MFPEMRLQDFLFKRFFPRLTDDTFFVALEMVKTRFAGVASLWSICDSETRQAKIRLCYSNLLAWQLMQLYPDEVEGIASMGAIPISSKQIGDVAIRYLPLLKQQGHGILDSLVTNPFGQQALLELQSAPEAYMLQV